MTTSVEEMIEKYIAAWNLNDPEELKKGFSECWAEDATYTDPNFDLVGIEGIVGLAKLSLEKFPDRKFQIVTMPEHHHRVGRYSWKVIRTGATGEGTDYFEFNEEFKITRIVSFL